VAREQDGGALRQHVQKGACATHQVATYSERRVASLHVIPVAETVYHARRQQGLDEMSPMRQPSPAGYQRRHGVKDGVSTGETRGVRWGKPTEEASPITVSGKWRCRHPGGGPGRNTYDGRAAKRARREGPGPVSIPFVKVRQG
jgi:hypothetical protein